LVVSADAPIQKVKSAAKTVAETKPLMYFITVFRNFSFQ
jgi:hypothetical protein